MFKVVVIVIYNAVSAEIVMIICANSQYRSQLPVQMEWLRSGRLVRIIPGTLHGQHLEQGIGC